MSHFVFDSSLELGFEHKVALRLHTLHPVDCDWILRQLDEPVRARILVLLQELKTLGIRATSAAVDSVDTSTEFDHDESAHWLALIDAATSVQIEEILRCESEVVRHCLFDMYEWSWREQLKGSDGKHECYRKKEIEENIGITLRVKRSLLKATAQALKDGDSFFRPECDRSDKQRGFVEGFSKSIINQVRRICSWVR